jgi:hypothetical protein
MFVGGPWVCRNCADAMVRLPHDIEGKSPVLPESETVSRRVANSRDKAGSAGTVGPTRV